MTTLKALMATVKMVEEGTAMAVEDSVKGLASQMALTQILAPCPNCMAAKRPEKETEGA